ncbi:hypothetical protein ACP70R_043115 [Stipagrostis hirtigluma subsp. patula]
MQDHSWDHYTSKGISFVHTFNESNEQILVLPEIVTPHLFDNESGSFVVILRNGYMQFVGWHLYCNRVFIVNSWDKIWNTYHISVGSKAVFTLLDGKILMITFFDLNDSEKLNSLLPIKDHCSRCSADSRLRKIIPLPEGHYLVQKMVDPRIIEWTTR